MTKGAMRGGRAGWKPAVGAWGPVVAYMAAIFYISGQSDLPSPPGVVFTYDKMEHFIAYFGLALVAFRGAVLLPVVGRPGPFGQSLLIGTLYGAVDEYHQKFVIGRTMSALDWLADAVGTVAAVLIIKIVIDYRANGGKKLGGV